MRQRRGWQLTPTAADRFEADLRAAVANGERARRVLEYRARREASDRVRARLGIPMERAS